MDSLPDYEKIGSFYLGKRFDLAQGQVQDEKVLYEAKDLTTHALCVGMTGSGKTGLCLSLLEEAAIDGIPAICVDPKGDLGNLLLAFPDLDAKDFREWVEPAEAARQGLDIEQLAEQTAKRWRDGLESWGQDVARVKRYRDSVDVSIYTPGSNAGLPMTVLKSFNAPPAEIISDTELMRERVAGAAAGLLTLLGIDADPLSSREYILLANIFDTAWRKGHDLDLPTLIRAIQSPPMDKIGVFDLESFYPASERMKLSISLNNLLASPAFAGWLEGQPLDIKQLLYTPQGKPRLSIISIAHLSDSERMFFVTMLLNELLGWMRTQPGTSSLRGLFYMDEVYGYFPPSAKPPSKPPMLMLLKQARAFGLGIVLATQNPVDLDYKGLSNIGTWFLGRLQTQRDKDRVLDGLEGAAIQSGSKFDRGTMERTLSALGSRVFLMNNVHDPQPTIFHSRWALSFLRGPLSRSQIQKLMAPQRAQLTEPPNVRAKDAPSTGQKLLVPQAERPIVPNDVAERFWLASSMPGDGNRLSYMPGLLASVSCHYVRKSADVDLWLDRSLVVFGTALDLDGDFWKQAIEPASHTLELTQQPDAEYTFADVPAALLNSRNYKGWEKDLRDHLYRRVPLKLLHCAELKSTSQPGQDELDARMSWKQDIRELRDTAKEKLQEKYAAKIKSLEAKIRSAEQRLEREQAQYDKEKWNTVLNFGQTMLGALLGNKIRSRGVTTGRSATRAAQQRTDVVHANETLEQLAGEKAELQMECETEIRLLAERFSMDAITLEPLEIPCRKGDIQVGLLALLWIPVQMDANGLATPLVALPSPIQ